MSQLTLWVLRHGETQLNHEGKLRGWLDVPLDEHGIGEAQQDADFFRDISIDRLYTSDLQRAVRTAQIIGEAVDQIPNPLVNLRPLNWGALNGKDVKESEKITDPWFKKWETHPELMVENGESWDGFQNRVLRGVKTIVEDSQPGNSVILVTHLRVCILIRSWMLNGSKPLEGKAIQNMLRPELHQKPDEIAKYELDLKTSNLSLVKFFKVISKVGDYFSSGTERAVS